MARKPTGYVKVEDIPKACCPSPLPSWRQRRRQGLKSGDVVQCTTCDRRWKLVHTGYDDSDWWEWRSA